MTNKLSRRKMIESVFGGVGAVGLTAMLRPGVCHGNRWAGIRCPRTPGKAKHVISLFLSGGPSHVDLFDPKPELVKFQGQRPGSTDLRTERQTGGLMPSPFSFQKYGQSGIECSEMVKNMGSVIDDVVQFSVPCIRCSIPRIYARVGLVSHRHDFAKPAVAGVVDHLRAGNRKSKSARLCGPGFRQRRCGRTRRIGDARGIPAGGAPGNIFQRFRNGAGKDDPEPAKQVDGP